MEIHVNGIKICYLDQGEGTPILFIHGFPLSSELWKPQIATLEKNYRVIMPDLRGFGKSEVPAGPYHMETFAKDVIHLIEALGLKQVVLVGLSMGGYISFAFMRQYAAYVKALVLCDTRATADTDEARANRENNALDVEREGASIIADRMIPGLLSPSASPEVRSHVRDMIEQSKPAGIAAALRGMALRSDSSDLLSHIQIPTLIVVGKEDSLSTPDEMRGIHTAIAGSQFVEIPNAGHLPNLENPDAFNSALVAFLETLS